MDAQAVADWFNSLLARSPSFVEKLLAAGAGIPQPDVVGVGDLVAANDRGIVNALAAFNAVLRPSGSIVCSRRDDSYYHGKLTGFAVVPADATPSDDCQTYA